jgi:hypothetical protein
MFKRPSFSEQAYRADHPNVYRRSKRRGRAEPLLLLFYFLVLPIVSLLSGDDELSMESIWLGWAAITALGCIIAAFIESDHDRAQRYRAWLASYEGALRTEDRWDEQLRSQRNKSD